MNYQETAAKRTKMCRLIYEMVAQAPGDFCGEQREFYLPRMRDLLVLAGELDGQFMARAVSDIIDEEDAVTAPRVPGNRSNQAPQTKEAK